MKDDLKPTAGKLLKLLATRHAGDVFVPECKTGASSGRPGTMLRMDAWAMKKSWARPASFCYEIKVARSDFLRDEKWQGYLPYCSDFYFVAPHGLISPDELPPEAGLLVASKNLTRLYAKKKAARRDVDLPEDLYRYLLMWRTRIVSADTVATTPREWWAKWLREKELNRELGWKVSKALHQVIEQKIAKVEKENKRLKAQNESFADVRECLERLGVDEHYAPEWRVEQKVRETLPKMLGDDIDRLCEALGGFRGALKELEQKTALDSPGAKE